MIQKPVELVVGRSLKNLEILSGQATLECCAPSLMGDFVRAQKTRMLIIMDPGKSRVKRLQLGRRTSLTVGLQGVCVLFSGRKFV